MSAIIKRLTVFLLIAALLIPAVASARFQDVDESYAASVNRLVEYGIISGKSEGVFDPGGFLTRAEMAKISTIAAGSSGLAASSGGASIYSDLDGGHWASGYVNTAARGGLLLGYPNGTFRPEQQLTFAEAVTITLRLLGYGADVLGNNWPEAYLTKARELGLTAGMGYGVSDSVNRADTAVMIDRALLEDIYPPASPTPKKLIELMDYKISADCIILATSRENKSLLSDEISTTLGTYKKKNSTPDEYLTRSVKLVLDKDSRVVHVIPNQQSGKDIIVQSVVGSELAYTADGAAEQIKLDDSSVIYYQGAKRTFADVKSAMETGMTMTLYFSSGGAYDYSVIRDFEVVGPLVASFSFTGEEQHIGTYPINREGLRVIRDGYEASLSDIRAFDVLYYNTVSNLIQVYTDKVSGVYEKALPSKSAITRIRLSGTEYELETQLAASRLGEAAGAYKINDFVTLLLGRDGRVVSAVSSSASDLTTYGIILSGGMRISEDEDAAGTQEYYLKAFTVTGEIQEFKTDQDYTAYRRRVIRYEFKDGVFKPVILPTRRVSGKVDTVNNTIGGAWLAKDAKIIDLIYAPAANEPGEARAKLIELSELTVPQIFEDDVVYAYTDPKYGDIQFLILNNLTLGGYEFGILTEKTITDKENKSSSYQIDLKGTKKSFSIKGVFSPVAGQPVLLRIQDNSLLEMKALLEISTYGALDSIDAQRIRLGGTSYRLAPAVSVYVKRGFNYHIVPITDIGSYTMKNIRLFADKSIQNGGLVRVILFNE